MFGIILTSRGSPATRRRPYIDRGNPLPRCETTSPQYLEEPTAGSPRVRPAAEEPSPGLSIFEPESRTARTRRILGIELTYIAHPSFDDPGARDTILEPLPEPDGGSATRRGKSPEPPRPRPAGFCEAPLLSWEQEVNLFRKLNYVKFLAIRLRDRIDPPRATAAELDEIERLLAEAVAIRNRIIEANQRLIVSIAKKHVRPGDELSELVSDGNVALIQAVARFDYARGNKFSTYASWAIINGFRRRRREQNHRARFVTGHKEVLQSTADTRGDEHDQEKGQKQRQCKVERLLCRLDDRERRIIASRYGIGGGIEKTLKQIGEELGICKERVRQIEARAEDKLREPSRTEALDLSLA
jgi:RNA polymerase primary sigma factor